MRFLLIDQSAASEIVSERLLQVVSFDQGAKLADGLKTGIFDASVSRRIHFVERSGGVYVLTGEKSDNRIIFDLSRCDLFSGFSPEQCLLILQRALRFAIKLWTNLRLSASEHITTSKNAVFFPFPLTSHSSFRVVIEREPTFKKSVPAGGKTLLVFSAGTQDDLGAKDEPDSRVAVDALTGLASARGSVTNIIAQSPLQPEHHFKVTELGAREGRGLTSLSFSQWLNRLTKPQYAFATRVVASPERIEGPAGTGKTLCLILKCINTLKQSHLIGREHHSVFIAHGEATRRTINDIFFLLDDLELLGKSRNESSCSLTVTTLQEWSAKLLGERISEAELLDRDAMGAKELQLLYIIEALQESVKFDLPTYAKLMSAEFLSFIENENEWRTAEMLRHEIGVTIKGRASESWERYKQLPSIRYNLPARNAGDLAFLFNVFNRYKVKLEQSGQFDTDDVILTALGQLDTPLWRRRRARDGFDSIFIDETHLFNLNELSLFHHLTRRDGDFPIAFAVDRAQAVGDRGLTELSIGEAITREGASRADETKIATVFRCAPAILNAAQTVTASGATLFTNFENPLSDASSAFTSEEEQKSALPKYTGVLNDELAPVAFERANALADELGCSRSAISIVCFSGDSYKRLARFAKERNKPIELLERRGDLEVVARAARGNLFILSAPEYVGGLEFDAVILVGVDELNVPPSTGTATIESKHFVEYAAHNLLYVALTRARYRVEILGDKTSKPSKLLRVAITAGLIEVSE
ncbi:UvrD-helicase domain-containing protein [Myxococcus xanthus]|uniref:UvrD-helicase domain-containing protein n=1 Tax=Myxococcus xanthus TaxID=34 RepID=UPI00112B22BE|nr:UvrD-helicase domain-containing protein [Myxococcus xanthus]